MVQLANKEQIEQGDKVIAAAAHIIKTKRACENQSGALHEHGDIHDRHEEQFPGGFLSVEGMQ